MGWRRRTEVRENGEESGLRVIGINSHVSQVRELELYCIGQPKRNLHACGRQCRLTTSSTARSLAYKAVHFHKD